MKSDTLPRLLASLGASRSFSRPHVSDDNLFSEAELKTLKYQLDYPSRFESELAGRACLQDFFGWHDDEPARNTSPRLVHRPERPGRHRG